MNILFLTLSKIEDINERGIYTDLVRELSERGINVYVVSPRQKREGLPTELSKEGNINILKVKTGNITSTKSFVEKGLSTIMIEYQYLSAIRRYFKNVNFDMVIYSTPPITFNKILKYFKTNQKSKTYLMLKDIFPQNAIDLGMMRSNGLIHKYFLAKEKELYITADIIGCMSPANKKYIIKHNPWLNEKNVEIFPNTKKLSNDIKTQKFPMRKNYGISKEACVFLFGGNMGRPQYIELLCNAVKKCKDDNNIFFLFVGRGTDRYKLEDTIKENDIKNALVIQDLPRNEYEQITKECDVGLIILDPRFTIPNYPSRILSYMEYAKPVLAATDKVSDIKELIVDAQCGDWVWSGDMDSFVLKIKEMATSKDLLVKGENGRKYIEKNLKVDKCVEILEKHFK